MLKLKELRLIGIGRFVEEQVINFDDLGNLVQVDGLNNNTGGSSGAGKSTVFNALDFLFGLNDIPNTVLQSRLTKDPICVTAKLEFNDRPLTISRGKKLSIDLDGEVTVGSSKLTEEKLDSILGMPRDLFRKILHKRQKEGGFFLSLTPKETNDFLTMMLDLGTYKSKVEMLSVKIDELEKQKQRDAAAYQAANSAYRACMDGQALLGNPPEKEVDQSTILSLKEKSEASRRDLDLVILRHKSEIEQADKLRPVVTSTPFDRSKLEAFESQRLTIQKSSQELFMKERERQSELKKKIAELKTQLFMNTSESVAGNRAEQLAPVVALEIKKIRDSLCPTCEQTWTNDLAKKKEADLLANLKNLKTVIDNGKRASELVSSLSLEISALEESSKPRQPEGLVDLNTREIELSELILIEKGEERLHQDKENTMNRIVQDQFASTYRLLREQHAKELESVRGQSELDRRALEMAVNKLRGYDEARARYDRSMASWEAQLASYKSKYEELTGLLTACDAKLSLLEELRKAVKSYLSCSYDEALETIGDTATRLIRSIPNMANATIQLEGIRETKDGKVKEEVNAVIHMDGDEAVPIKSLCGGERSSIDLAVDLSVIDFIENKANKGIDIFVLDEPFTGLDTVCIEMALEVLKNSNMNKKLIIVDHNPEVKQMVESKILVVRDGLTSKIAS